MIHFVVKQSKKQNLILNFQIIKIKLHLLFIKSKQSILYARKKILNIKKFFLKKKVRRITERQILPIYIGLSDKGKQELIDSIQDSNYNNEIRNEIVDILLHNS